MVKRLVGGVVFATVLMVAPRAFSSAEADPQGEEQIRPDQALEKTYYSDATKTVVIGQTYAGCMDYSWGSTSPYYSYRVLECNVPVE